MTLVAAFLAGVGSGLWIAAAAYYYLSTDRSWWP